MQLIDARRLTGPTHLSRHPLVVVEIGLDDGESLDTVIAAYRHELDRMRGALGADPGIELLVRPHRGGAILAYAAPIDVMLAWAEASEWAAQSAVEVLAGRGALPLEPKRSELADLLARDTSPQLLALAVESKKRGLPLLWDDEVVSLGSGRGAIAYPRHALPQVAEVTWSAVSAIAVALVTGTNGKTTSSRLLARIAREAGKRVALASTDGIEIGDETVEAGDWTGPAAARIALRRTDVELAVLETARGGILRRGLAVETCDAALVTNVSADHLGLYGIDDVAAMAKVKAVVLHAVVPGGTAVVNAHDPRLVALAAELACGVTFFADLDGPADAAARATIASVLAGGGRAVVAEGGAIVAVHGARRTELVPVAEVPITFGGSARYNVQNVLGAVAMARALGLPDAAIDAGLRAFGMKDNPGRGQVVVRGGVTVVLDFGHNAEGVRAVLGFVQSLRAPAGRLWVSTASPGDRTDAEIEAVARAIHAADPARVYVRDLPDYLRGRAAGEIPALFERTFAALGLPADRFAHAASEVASLEQAYAAARAGDVVVVFVHLAEEAVRAFLEPPI